jgi:mRNA interferase MazF
MNRYEVWLADLDPSFGTVAGKKRPVVIIQTDFLNNHHNSTIICPITTKIVSHTSLTRIALKAGEVNLRSHSDIMIDQLRAIDNIRFIVKIGNLPTQYHAVLDQNLRDILDL